MTLEKGKSANNIGNKVKALRKRAGLSQQHIAAYLEVDLDFVESLEKGNRKLSTVKLERISELFGCPSDLLCKEEIPTKTFDYAFHTIDGQQMDLKDIAAINRIILNLLEMQRLRSAGEFFKNKTRTR
jgi:transcriptional regulator with XRE-family HTH domain